MIGIVLVTHGNLALEFLSAMEHVVGPQEQVETVCMAPEDDAAGRRDELVEKVEKVNSGEGVIILTDMFGGTPSNLAISIMEDGKIDALAGINLPMLIKIASCRQNESLKDCIINARDAGRKYINAASAFLDGDET